MRAKRRDYLLSKNHVLLKIVLAFLLLFVESSASRCMSSNKTIKAGVMHADETVAERSLEQTCHQGKCVIDECECNQGWTGEYCDQCSGRVLLTENTGIVSDGPNEYGTETECSWLIQPTINAPIRLTFREFASECGWDYLYVYDGDSAFAPLLATFNGLLQIQDSTVDKFYPEIMTSSGSVFLYFFSDVAYTMQGFNISYAVQECPNNCMGHGICKSSGLAVYCECNHEWTGNACEHPTCPKNCSETLGHGTCANNSLETGLQCQCELDFQNFACSASIPPRQGFWAEELVAKSPFNTARASHSSVLINEQIWVFGGMQFGDLSNANDMFSYDIERKQWEIAHPASSSRPSARYGHCLIAYQDQLLMFGGRHLFGIEVSDELWNFRIKNQTWSKIPYTTDFWNATDNVTSPLALWGHSCTLVDFSNKSNVLVVIFGFHPEFEYSGFIYEYDLIHRSWSIAETTGAFITASYGHTAAWDPFNKVIYIHGGFRRLDRRSYGVDDTTYMYNPQKRLFTNLRSSGISRYLHTAVVSDGIMYIYGGCTHSDSDKSTGALCFSSSFMAYKIACDTWGNISTLDQTYHPNRYGHSAVIAPSQDEGNTAKMMLLGGYAGTMLENILFFQMASCSAYSQNETFCIGQILQDLLCTWNGTSCVPVMHRRENSSCPSDSSSYCDSFSGCSSCMNSFEGCVSCNGKCNMTCGLAINDPSNCTDVNDAYCSRYQSCLQCQLTGSCHWDDKGTCVPGKVVADYECSEPCGVKATCTDCVGKNDCMWCANEGICVSTTSYVVQFPYGECMKWVNKKNQCQGAGNCVTQRTCTNCQKLPFCGWCDDGSETGLGRCQSGKGSGSFSGGSNNTLVNWDEVRYNESIPACMEGSWYFAECPACQCNGHSKCINDTSECESCQNKTAGNHCETCMDGFFGDATNGGRCQLCECGGRAALCNNTSGTCFCSTKGEIGDKCDRCDNSAKYYGNPVKNGTCFYRLLINYSFTFTLTTNNDKYVTAINFENTPPLTATSQLSFESQQLCNVRLAVHYSQARPDGYDNETMYFGRNLDEGYEIEVTEYSSTTKFSFDFSGSKYGFGDPSTNATIRIYVQNFTIPTWIQVSLVQRSNSLLMLLLILFSCFLVILLLTAVGWKLKMFYDSCQLRRQQAEQLEQMASRPFSTVHIDFDNLSEPEQVTTAKSTLEVLSEEVSADGSAAAVSVMFWMPSGNFSDMSSVDEDKSMNSIASELISGNTALAFGTTLISRSDRVATIAPAALFSHEMTSESAASKLKVVFKRGRRRTISIRQSTRQRASHPSSLHQEAGDRPHGQCGMPHNQYDDVPDRTASADNLSTVERPNSRTANRSWRRALKRGRSSFTSIGSGSVSPANQGIGN